MDAERSTRRDPAGARGTLADVALLLVVWAVMVALVDPRGDFPLNDDWAFAGSVRLLLDEHVFRLPGWASMTLITQTLWGALVSLVAGFSYTALRASTLLLAGACIVATYLLARQLRATRGIALLAALVLAANPLFVILAHSFMTDVPTLALMLYALLAFARALQTGSRAAWAVGTLLTIAAALCRQPGLVVTMGLIAAVLLRPPDRRRWLALAALSLLLGVGALGAFQFAMNNYGTPLPNAYYKNALFLTWLWQMPLQGALRFLISNLFVTVLYCGLFLLPLLTVCAASLRSSRWNWALGVTALVIGGLSLWSSGRRMPMRVNVLIESGLGPITLNDWYIRNIANDPRLPPAFWWTLTVVGLGAAALLVVQCVALIVRVWRERTMVAAPAAPGRALLLVTTLLYVASACAAIQFDRYFMPIVPLLGVALLPADAGRAISRWRWLAATLPLLLLAGYAVAGTHDYMAWNRARWEALHQLAEDGVEARRIDGGLEFNAPLFYIEGSSSGGGTRSWWWVADDEYIIAMGPIPGYEVAREVPYSRWMPPQPSLIAVLHRRAR